MSGRNLRSRNPSEKYTREDSRGNLWGVYDDYQGTTGWVPMEYMELVYDSIAFREEHEAQITGDAGELDEKYVGETICLWEYPGSEEYTPMEVSDYTPEYRGIYVDGNGKRWGCVGYYFGIRDTWVCIDEPTADFEQIFPEGAAAMAAVDQKTEDKALSESRSTERIVPKLNRNLVVTACILVILVVAVTAVLLVKLKGGKSKS